MPNPLDALIRRAADSPEGSAVWAGITHFTHASLLETTRRIASVLRAEGVRPGQIIGVNATPPLHVAMMTALLHEGAVSFAAHPRVVERFDRDIDAIYTDNVEFAARFPRARLMDVEWLRSLSSVDPTGDPHHFPDENAVAQLVFSSGTTGTPKGVPFTIANLRERTAAAHRNWMPAQPFLSELGLDTSSGVQSFYWSLFSGSEFVLSGTSSTNATNIELHRIASIKTSPAKLKALVDAVERDDRDVSSVRTVYVAGSVLGVDVADRFASVFDAELVYLYGSTETGTVTRLEFDGSAPTTVGAVVEGAEINVLDNDGQPVSDGGSGIIRMRTPYMSNGYWNDENATEKSFRGGWFYPGDAGHLDGDSRLVVEGRTDELINSSGSKINPAWVDTQVAGFRGISDLASFALVGDDGTSTLAFAYVSTQSISSDELAAHLRERLGERIPLSVHRVGAIPRNAMGKVNRSDLALRVRETP